MTISFERNLDLTEIQRDGYTWLDWFSDIGGMQGMLINCVAVILAVWNYNYFDNFVA